MNDHTTFEPLVSELREDVTTFSMDRRGFGASADATHYAIEREFEDVAAVVDAVAQRTGGPVPLWGHSFGAGCAMGGAALTDNVRRLVLYEPGLGLRYPEGSIEAIERAVAAGDWESAMVAVYGGILEMGEEEIEPCDRAHSGGPASPPPPPCPGNAEPRTIGGIAPVS